MGMAKPRFVWNPIEMEVKQTIYRIFMAGTYIVYDAVS